MKKFSEQFWDCHWYRGQIKSSCRIRMRSKWTIKWWHRLGKNTWIIFWQQWKWSIFSNFMETESSSTITKEIWQNTRWNDCINCFWQYNSYESLHHLWRCNNVGKIRVFFKNQNTFTFTFTFTSTFIQGVPKKIGQ